MSSTDYVKDYYDDPTAIVVRIHRDRITIPLDIDWENRRQYNLAFNKVRIKVDTRCNKWEMI